MGVRRILTYPEASLKDMAEDVSNITGETIQAIDDMPKPCTRPQVSDSPLPRSVLPSA